LETLFIDNIWCNDLKPSKLVIGWPWTRMWKIVGNWTYFYLWLEDISL
jgi:hypothetical protein